MPTYQYVCAKCGHEFELVQSMKDESLATCPKDRCARKPWAKGKVKRQMSGGAGLIFKGSGFYITDYRSEGYKKSAKQESDNAAPKKDSGTKPEAKPAGGGGSAGGGGAKPAKE